MQTLKQVKNKMTYNKIGNRYYKVEDNKVIKATKDEDGNYHECGTMSIEDFKAGKMVDGNTVECFSEIKANLKMKTTCAEIDILK